MAELLFEFRVTNGYAFRGILEFLTKLAIRKIPIVFTEDRITIFAKNQFDTDRERREIYTNISIDVDEIIYYYINPKKLDELQYHVEIVNVDDLYACLKNVSKTGGARLYKFMHEDKDKIYIENNNNLSKISTLKSDSEEINRKLNEKCEDEFEDERPNVKIVVEEFCNSIDNLVKSKPFYGVFRAYEDGLWIGGKDERGHSISESHWGNIEGRCYETRIPCNVLKALSKLKNMIKNNIIKIYSSEDEAICISHKIDVFGEQFIVIKN